MALALGLLPIRSRRGGPNLKRPILALCVMLISAWASFAGINPPGGHGSGHAPEMTDVALFIAGLASLGGYLAIRRRMNRQK